MAERSKYETLLRDRSEAYDHGRYAEAAILHEQMAELSMTSQDNDRLLEHRVWAGMCHQLAGKPLRAMALFAEALNEAPPGASEWDVWLAHIQSFEVLRDYLGDHRTLWDYLSRLKQMEGQNRCWTRSDVLWLEAGALEAQGRWDEACRCLDQAWAQLSRSFMKFLIAEYAVRIHLTAGRFEEAKNWSAQLGRTERHFSESRIAHLEAEGRLALWARDVFALQGIAERLEHETAGLQRPLWEGRAVRIRARTYLLRPELGDPEMSTHPTKRLLQTPVHGGVTREERFQRRLLLLDYRLASLRYALGIEPQEDFYGLREELAPIVGPPRVSEAEIERRRQKALRTLSATELMARSLDRCFESDWRRREVQRRGCKLEGLTHDRRVLCRTL